MLLTSTHHMTVTLLYNYCLKVTIILKRHNDPCFESISKLSVIVFSTAYINNDYYLIAVRQYFAITIILADQNHTILLLQLGLQA